MAYELITSERSPFGRICRIFMHNYKIGFDLRFLNFLDNREDAAALAQETPINKVPILVVNGIQKVFDSRVIINYLAKTHETRALCLEEENFVSAVYSCLDVSVILFLMKRNGYDLNADNAYLKRQAGRIPRNLEYLKPWAAKLDPNKPQDWSYASISLYCFLDWADKRAGTVQLKDHPELQGFHERFARAPGVLEHPLPAN